MRKHGEKFSIEENGSLEAVERRGREGGREEVKFVSSLDINNNILLFDVRISNVLHYFFDCILYTIYLVLTRTFPFPFYSFTKVLER